MTLNRLRCRSDFRLSDFDAELKKIGAAMQATLQKKLKNEGVLGDQQGRNILGVVFGRQGVQARSVASKPCQTRVREVYGVNRPTSTVRGPGQVTYVTGDGVQAPGSLPMCTVQSFELLHLAPGSPAGP